MRTVDPRLWASELRKPPPSQQFGLPARAGREARLRRGLRASLREYRRRCCVRGARLLLPENETTLDENIYRLFLALLFLVGCTTLGYSCYSRQVQPAVEVSLPFQEHSINNIPFPAVAVCSYNLMSRSMLTSYAKELMQKDRERRYTEPQLLAGLMKLGALVDHTLHFVDVNFFQHLRRIDPARANNITFLMLSLSRPCSEQLLQCSWRGIPQSCDQLFAARATPLGFCCVFNGRYTLQDLDNEPKTLNMVGQDEGLSIVVQRQRADFSYVRRNIIGSEILIFDGFEYPLLESGAVRSYSVPLHASAYLVLSAREQLATENVHRVSEERRGCRFRRATRPRSSQSSYGWCLVLCRRDAVRSLCGCVPFYLLPRKTDFVCSLNQLGCMNKYREKLLMYYPPDTEPDITLMEEFADSLYCAHCVPDCTRTRYSAAVYFSRYHAGKKIFKNFFSQNVTLGNTTVVRIFYTNEDQRLFYLGVTERWFETLSILGGESALLLGVSLLTLPELVYFLTVRWRRHCSRDGMITDDEDQG